jgi:hypothetical protein
MKKLELAYEIIKESKKSRALYLESGRDYHKVAAHMYSIFECYAHGLIKWNTARTYWHSSILEYLNLYKDNNKLYVMESNRMLAEYEDTLNRFKPALDEYKKVSEAKMVSNIVVKKQISESVAKDHSNIYFNKRSLSESAIKDIAHTTDWKKVVESYTNLTSNDKDRLRMLTIFENDTFNVTGWSKLNEGPTLDTTQMITTVMSEEPMTTSIRPVARPGKSLPGGGYQWPNGAVEPGAGAKFMTDMPTPKARPANLTKSNTPAAGSNLAPTTSIRPQRRPASNVGRREMSPTPGVMDGSTRGFESVQKEGYKTIKSIDKERYDEIPGLEGPFMTLSGKVVYYDPKEGSYYDRDTDMYLSYEEFKELDNDYSGMKNTRDMKEASSNKIACVKCDEVSTAKAWEKNNGFCPKCKTSSQGVAESSDYAKRRKEADDEYYGKKKPKPAAKAVAKTDYQKRREVNEAEEGTYMKQWYDYSEDFAMLELYVDGKLVDQWNDYFGANVTGNPLQQKFIDMAKKNGVDPIGLKVIDGEDGNEGVFTSSGLKWNSTEAKAKPGHNARAMARAQDIIRKSIEQSQKNVGKKDDKKKDQVDEAEATHWEVSYDHGPHQSNTVSVKAKSKEEALDKAKQVAKDVHKHNRITSIAVSPKKNESLREAKSYVGRETKDGTWRVFKTGNAVAVAGPFKSAQEAQAWIKKQSMQEKVNEAVTLDYSRHLRSHGKKPRDPGYSALWMFTTREYDMPDDDEIFKFQGSFADAKKAAAKWAKTQGAYRVYVME